MPYKTLISLITKPFAWLLAILFLVEETIWDWTAARMVRLSALRSIRAIERRISARPPKLALFAFLLPSIILIPAKLIGLHAMAAGHVFIGAIVFLLAKFVGMALFSRIFNLTRPALMQIPRFAAIYEVVMRYRNRIHAYLDGWVAYQRVKQVLRDLKVRLACQIRFKPESK